MKLLNFFFNPVVQFLILQNTFVVHEVPVSGTLKCSVSIRDDVRTYYQQHRGLFGSISCQMKLKHLVDWDLRFLVLKALYPVQ